MKTHNHHPEWIRKPLRLTKEQEDNPASVFEDFFECYGLNDTREILWDWMIDAVCSSRSTSNDPIDRSNNIFFYENIEKVIEAAFIINGKSQKSGLQDKQ